MSRAEARQALEAWALRLRAIVGAPESASEASRLADEATIAADRPEPRQSRSPRPAPRYRVWRALLTDMVTTGAG